MIEQSKHFGDRDQVFGEKNLSSGADVDYLNVDTRIYYMLDHQADKWFTVLRSAEVSMSLLPKQGENLL